MPVPGAAAQIQTGKRRPAWAFKLLHRSRILKRGFRDLQRVDYWGMPMLRLCAQIHCQYEARAISAFSSDIAPHNPSVSSLAHLRRLGAAIAAEPLAKGIQDNSPVCLACEAKPYMKIRPCLTRQIRAHFLSRRFMSNGSESGGDFSR